MVWSSPKGPGALFLQTRELSSEYPESFASKFRFSCVTTDLSCSMAWEFEGERRLVCRFFLQT